MSNNAFSDLQPRLSAFTEGAAGGALRAQQALVTFLFSASQAQFGFSRAVAEDLTEALRANPTNDPVGTLRGLVTRWHDRSEQAITEFRRIGDELRNSLYESVGQPLQSAASGNGVEKATPAASPAAKPR